MKKTISILFLTFLALTVIAQSTDKVRLGVAGLTHGHVHWILGKTEADSYEVVGIAEKNNELVDRLFGQYSLSKDIRYRTLEEMIKKAEPEAVVAFNSIHEHLEVVEACAPQGIHVMVEKPLAVSNEHAQKMARLARENNILLLTNYETTWYGTTQKLMKDVLEDKFIGEIRKIIVRDGHFGPKEIGVSEEFFQWLTDPELNGGGALIDFGCYGANLITRLMRNERPETVTAITQQIKPHIYSKVDDEATIILTYPGSQGIIQASWNWPMHRKDMDVYGTEGVIYQYNGEEMEIKTENYVGKTTMRRPEAPFNDPFLYFSAVVRGEIAVHPLDLSSLENNLIVVEILDAARRSSNTGTTIRLER